MGHTTPSLRLCMMKNGDFTTLRRQLARRYWPFMFDDDGKLASLIIAERILFKFLFYIKEVWCLYVLIIKREM